MSQLTEITNRFKELQEKYNQYLPNIDPALINDLLLRQIEDPSVTPLFTVEIFLKSGISTERLRDDIKEKTGMNATMFDNNTHCVITQKLTIDKLKEISEINGVLEITGKFIGRLEDYETFPEKRHEKANTYQDSDRPGFEPVKKNYGIESGQSSTGQKKKRKSEITIKTVALVSVGIVAVIALAGFIISGGMLPNVNQNNIAPSTAPTTDGSSVVGALHGYVSGPTGLPAVGASVIAANQNTGFTENALISINGQYFLNNLPVGEYIVMVAYPDGTNDVVNEYQIESGSNHELDFAY
jgi:Carboxypeptidase regulatory-like domain